MQRNRPGEERLPSVLVRFGIIWDSCASERCGVGGDFDAAVPKSAVNVEYVTKQIEEKLEEDATADVTGMLGGVAGNAEDDSVGGKAAIVKDAMEQLTRMARKKPYYQKNKAPICTFWLKDACTRADCPFRPCNGDTHMPELSANAKFRKQNIKDRYYRDERSSRRGDIWKRSRERNRVGKRRRIKRSRRFISAV